MSHQNDYFCCVMTTMAIFSDIFLAGLLSLFTFKTFVSSLFQVHFSISFNTIFEKTTAVRQGGTSLLKETKFQLFFLTELLPALVPSVQVSLVFLDLPHNRPLRLLFPPCEISSGFLLARSFFFIETLFRSLRESSQCSPKAVSSVRFKMHPEKLKWYKRNLFHCHHSCHRDHFPHHSQAADERCKEARSQPFHSGCKEAAWKLRQGSDPADCSSTSIQQVSLSSIRGI